MAPSEEARLVELRTHQAVCAATIVALPLISAAYDRLTPSQIDPPFFRWLFVTCAAAVLIASLASAAFRPWTRSAVFTIALGMVLWVVWLAAANHYTTPRVLGVLLVHLCIGQLFVSWRLNLVLHLVVVGALAVGAWVTPAPNEIAPTVVAVTAGIIGVVGVTVAVRQERLIGELQQARDSLEERVAERTRELEEANQAKSRFLANMSHELRTPLNAVIGYGELMRDDLGEAGTVQRGDLERVLSASRHLLAMINDVLDLAKVEAGHWTPSFEAVDVGAVVAEVVATVRPLAEANRNRVTTQIELREALWTDRKRVLQVLVNLMSNAAKFTEGGEIHVTARRDGEELHLSVADTGSGIPADKQAAVFDKFVQLQDASSRRHPGTGLGLAICAEIAQAFGGRIELESEVGVGSTFTLRLPWRAAAPVELRQAS